MKFSTTLAAVMSLGTFKMVAANPGDMIIDFPGLLRPRASAVAAASSTNLLAFSSALGGATAEPVTSTGDSTRPFAVGTETFTDFNTAATRSCNNQHNACAAVANGHGSSANGLTVGECDTQQTQCQAAAASGPSSTGSSNASVSIASVATSAAVVESASAAAQTAQASSSSVAVVVQSTSTTSSFAVQGTLHSSDENSFFFCD